MCWCNWCALRSFILYSHNSTTTNPFNFALGLRVSVRCCRSFVYCYYMCDGMIVYLTRSQRLVRFPSVFFCCVPCRKTQDGRFNSNVCTANRKLHAMIMSELVSSPVKCFSGSFRYWITSKYDTAHTYSLNSLSGWRFSISFCTSFVVQIQNRRDVCRCVVVSPKYWWISALFTRMWNLAQVDDADCGSCETDKQNINERWLNVN